MAEGSCDRMRRRLMLGLFGGYLMAPETIGGVIGRAFAMGEKQIPQGVQEVRGRVEINGIPATVGSVVAAGDTITTGPDGHVVFILQHSVYMVRANSTIEMESKPGKGFKQKASLIIKMLNGKLLTAFGRGKKRLLTATAVVGIRGTALYLESEPTRTYVCTCYGIATISSRFAEGIHETVNTRHHDQPRFVYPPGTGNTIARAPVFNHTDEELILMERLVGRRPPFMDSTYTY